MARIDPRALSLAAILLVCAPAPGFAQPAAARVQQLTTDAMSAFHELDLDRADALLEQARTMAERENVEPRISARVHLSMGVVAVSGHGDAQRAQLAFMRALELDPAIEPDPMTSTPEVTTNFQVAKARRASSVRAPTTPAPTTPAPNVRAPTTPAPNVRAPTTPAPTTPAPSTPPSATPTRTRFPTVRHTPPPEALSHTPLPLYLELDNAPDANRVVVMYRGHGMRRYLQARLPVLGAGFGGELPCANVLAGEFVYYVVVYDSESRVIAGAGSDSLPLRVRIVERLSGRAPSLPGRPAPGICAPPGAAPAVPPAATPAPTPSTAPGAVAPTQTPPNP